MLILRYSLYFIITIRFFFVNVQEMCNIFTRCCFILYDIHVEPNKPESYDW